MTQWKCMCVWPWNEDFFCLTLSPPGVFLKMSPESPEIHLCFLQNFAVIHQMVKFDFPSRFWCHSNHHPKKNFLGTKNVSYNHIFRAHFRDEKTRAEPLTYIYVVGLTGVPLKTRIYTWLGVKGLSYNVTKMHILRFHVLGCILETWVLFFLAWSLSLGHLDPITQMHLKSLTP